MYSSESGRSTWVSQVKPLNTSLARRFTELGITVLTQAANKSLLFFPIIALQFSRES